MARYKAKIVITKDDEKPWVIDRVDYVTSDVNPETGKHFPFGKTDFIDGKVVGITVGKKVLISK